MQFQAICSKWNRKLTLSLTAESIDEARELLHGQGYSIMEIRQAERVQEKGTEKNFFYFDIRINNQIKTWKIQSDDVFKSYKKLVDDLWYDVVYIYTNEGMSEEQKKVITAKVRDSYRLYKATLWENIDEKKIERSEDEVEKQQISPQILREIEHYALIGDSTIEKIQNLLLKYHTTIPDDKKIELEKLEHSILQTKGSSNLWKIRTVVEGALKSIWEIELVLVKTWMAEEKKKFLEETNSLLKQIGSSDRIETDKKESLDIWKTLTNFIASFTDKGEWQKKWERKPVDTNSFIYYKNQRELNLYRDTLSKTVVERIKALFTLNFALVKRLTLKKRLLLQNIQIIENRINNKNVSYTKIAHGFEYYIDSFLFWLREIVDIGIYTIYGYITIYISLQILRYFSIVEFSLYTKSFLFITIFSVFIFLFSFTRSMMVFFITFFLFILSFSFLSINF